jgi:NADH-quinone oxidoreductase subunit F
MEGKTICVFADAAAWPVQSYIAKFRNEFEEYISRSVEHSPASKEAAAHA